MSAAPRYCIECDRIQVALKKDVVLLQYMSNGEVVRTQEVAMQPRAGYTLDLKLHCFIPVDEKPPERYSVDDLMKMLAEKGVWKS